VLPFGRILRKLKINELPQLMNVLMGHMSLVGPRPQSRRNFEAYSAEVQKQIVAVRPGLTGLASLVFRDEERFLLETDNPDEFYDQEIMPYKGAVEAWFVENLGFKLYVEVIGITALVLLFKVRLPIRNIFPGMPRHPIFTG
jgi:lipopolysaccharide/colanic/teichoic acid biosynthesis glycosyltransferase